MPTAKLVDNPSRRDQSTFFAFDKDPLEFIVGETWQHARVQLPEQVGITVGHWMRRSTTF
jgi:hypothetical protein